MQSVKKFQTLMSETYQVKFEPSACQINPYLKVITHKTRPRLEEVNLRNRYRRSLSQLLNSKAVDPVMDKNHSSLGTLHRFENRLQGQVSKAAPSKEHQKYAALR